MSESGITPIVDYRFNLYNTSALRARNFSGAIMDPGRRVAIVECEAIIALDITEILHSLQVENIHIFRNLTSLFGFLSNNNAVDLVIIDTPDQTVAEKIRLITYGFGIPVLFLSELPDEKEINGIKNCSYLKKPYLRKELIKFLEKEG